MDIPKEAPETESGGHALPEVVWTVTDRTDAAHQRLLELLFGPAKRAA